MSGVDFQTYIRKNSDGTASFKYRVSKGEGTVGMRIFGMPDPDPAAQGQQHDLDPQRLRSSRFIHLSDTEMRKSYSFSRLTPDVLQGLPEGKWMQLAPRTEDGFRYLTLTGARGKTDATMDMPATPAPSEPMPPKQVPLPPDFAQKGFDSLNKAQAVELFRREAVKVEALHRRVEALEAALRQSHAREEDLLGLLRRWRGEAQNT